MDGWSEQRSLYSSVCAVASVQWLTGGPGSGPVCRRTVAAYFVAGYMLLPATMYVDVHGR